jgi:hypothetical protein
MGETVAVSCRPSYAKATRCLRFSLPVVFLTHRRRPSISSVGRSRGTFGVRKRSPPDASPHPERLIADHTQTKKPAACKDNDHYPRDWLTALDESQNVMTHAPQVRSRSQSSPGPPELKSFSRTVGERTIERHKDRASSFAYCISWAVALLRMMCVRLGLLWRRSMVERAEGHDGWGPERE